MTCFPQVLLATIECDAHTWNLVYLEALLEEHGAHVTNLGPCTPAESIISSITDRRPDLVVVSTVNGHGFSQGKQLISRCSRNLGDQRPPFVIGGKLTTESAGHEVVAAELLGAGFEEVFVEPRGVAEFREWFEAFKTLARAANDDRPVLRRDLQPGRDSPNDRYSRAVR